MKNLLTLFLLLIALQVWAQKISLPQDVVQNIEQRIEYGKNPGIVVGILTEDGPAYFSFGVKEKNGEKVDEHSIYEIGSISKTFTATLLADNVIKGEMSLDDPAQKYLPDAVKLPTYEGKEITLGNLADHTSSLPRLPSNFNPADPMNPYADYTIDQLYDFLTSYKITCAIGSEYEYSNLAVGLLGHILARKDGSSYEDLLMHKITGPLHMTETRITFDEHMKKNLAHGYANGTEVPNWDLPTLAGAGAIRSSAHDMLLYVGAQMNMPPSPLSDAIELTHKARHFKVGGVGIGLVWFVDKATSDQLIYHGGATGGYRAFVGFSELQKKGVVVLTNSDHDIDDIGMHLLNPDYPLNAAKPSLAAEIQTWIDKKGAKNLLKNYQDLKKKDPDKYEADENEINSLGYWYMNDQHNLEAAAALFEINVKEFPASSNVYDSYGEVLMNQGKTKDAVANYEKSLELNPGNMNAVEMLNKLGKKVEVPKPQVSEDVLETYTGTYELAPGFNLVISRAGSRLFGQATGQSKFELYSKSETEFYLTVTEARVVFSKNAAGQIGLILFQQGQQIPGKRL